jgi:hypothetical protein
MSQELMESAREWLQTRQEITTEIINKSWVDPDFKAALLANPKATIKNFLIAEGYTLPPNFEATNVRIEQETLDDMVFVLPVDPTDVALPDEVLDAISGGPEC